MYIYIYVYICMVACFYPFLSENEVNLKNADCFPGSAKVYSFEHGPIEIDKLKVGDRVLTKRYVNGQFKELYTEVIGFLDYISDLMQPYLVFKTEIGLAFATTKSHLLYTVSNKSSKYCEKINFEGKAIGSKAQHLSNHQTAITYSDDESRLLCKSDMLLQTASMKYIIDIKPAYSISVGDRIIILNNSSTYTTKITGISFETRRGAIAPLTKEGNIIVNNILASCYAKITDAKLAHTAFMLYRYTATVLPVEIRQKYLDWYIAILRELNDIFEITLLH